MLLDMIRGGFSIGTIITGIISSLAVIFLTLPVHEFAHGFTAYKLGDPTAKYQGRLTLNPLAHIDYLGAICILVFGFGWAKPVQVNARYFNNPKRDMAITALAGPVSNLLMATLCMLLFNILGIFVYSESGILYFLRIFFYYVAYINIYLAVFNLIPIPPLDGSRLLSAFLPDGAYYKLMRYERYIFYVVLGLIWLGILDFPLAFLSDKIMSGISYITGLPFMFLG